MAPGGAKVNYDGFKIKCVGLIPLLQGIKSIDCTYQYFSCTLLKKKIQGCHDIYVIGAGQF